MKWVKGLLGFGAKAGDEVLIGAGKSIDELPDLLKGMNPKYTSNNAFITKTGSNKGNLHLPSGVKVQTANGKILAKPKSGYTPAQLGDGWSIVDESLIFAANVTTNVGKASVWNTAALGKLVPGMKTTTNLGWLSVVGGSTILILYPLYSLSSNLTETINNFFSGDSDSDGVPDEKGARNQLLLGGAVICLGLYSLSSFFSSGKKSSGEKQVVEIQVKGDTPTGA